MSEANRWDAIQEAAPIHVGAAFFIQRFAQKILGEFPCKHGYLVYNPTLWQLVTTHSEGHIMFDWLRFVGLSNPDLSHIDLAVINHACAGGLPGVEEIDVVAHTRQLNEYARIVRRTTKNLTPQFQRQRSDYQNSFAYFQALCLITVLQRDCGIRYNAAKIPDDVLFTPADTFLYGLLESKLGTCANIPALYASVGRRLGYPIKLVRAKGNGATHLFARWDDLNGERFNIEATSIGLRCPPDDYYRTGRYQVSPDIERKGQFLESMAPREELASLLAERSLIWTGAGNYRRAAEALAWASSLAPKNAFYWHTLRTDLEKWKKALEARKPKGFFPRLLIRSPFRRFPLLDLNLERDIFGLEATENMLGNREHDRLLWEPMRKGMAPARVPLEALVDFAPESCHIQLRFVEDERR